MSTAIQQTIDALMARPRPHSQDAALALSALVCLREADADKVELGRRLQQALRRLDLTCGCHVDSRSGCKVAHPVGVEGCLYPAPAQANAAAQEPDCGVFACTDRHVGVRPPARPTKGDLAGLLAALDVVGRQLADLVAAA